MSFFNTCYETTYGSIYNNSITKLKNHINDFLKYSDMKYRNDYRLNTVSTNNVINVFLTNINNTEVEKNIQLFNHPVFIDGKEKYLITDLRMLLKQRPQNEYIENVEVLIKNTSEFYFHKNRAILNSLWVGKDVLDIKTSLFFSCKVLCNLLSNNITKAYNLDYKQKSVIEIITAFYFQNLFIYEDEIDEDDAIANIIHTIKILNLPEEFVRAVYDVIPKYKNKPLINNINDYCSVLVKVLDDRKMSNFGLANLLSLISNSWYGSNYKELMACSLEHPPTWISIVHLCCVDKGYKNTTISNIINNANRQLSEEYVKNFNVIVNRLQTKE